jgi:hypothetical protein
LSVGGWAGVQVGAGVIRPLCGARSICCAAATNIRAIRRAIWYGSTRGNHATFTEYTMTDVSTAADKRTAKAKHEFIDQNGNVVDGIEAAVGIRYTDLTSGKGFDYKIVDAKPGSSLTMLAIFGAKTKATNETSRVRNGKNGGVSNPIEELEALDEVFESITNGVWREKAEGGGGSRTDKALLATVLIELLGASAKGDVAHYVSRFESDKTYMQKVLKSDAGIEYRNRAGKAGPAVDTLA